MRKEYDFSKGERGKFYRQNARIHPPTQETTALAVEECVNVRYNISAINLSCFGGFRSLADDPPKPWRLRTEALQRPGA